MLTDRDIPEARRAGACGLACCRVRKRWGLDAPVGAFNYHVNAGAFIYHVDAGAFVHHVDVLGSTVISCSACAIYGCVVLPAH